MIVLVWAQGPRPTGWALGPKNVHASLTIFGPRAPAPFLGPRPSPWALCPGPWAQKKNNYFLTDIFGLVFDWYSIGLYTWHQTVMVGSLLWWGLRLVLQYGGVFVNELLKTLSDYFKLYYLIV